MDPFENPYSRLINPLRLIFTPHPPNIQILSLRTLYHVIMGIVHVWGGRVLQYQEGGLEHSPLSTSTYKAESLRAGDVKPVKGIYNMGNM